MHFGNPGACDAPDAGLPALPHLSEMIRLPDNMKAMVSVERADWIDAGTVRVFPFQPPRRDGNNNPGFRFNRQAYQADGPLPERLASIGHVQGWSGLAVTGLSVYPVRYYPATERIEIAHSITVRVDFHPDRSHHFVRPARPGRRTTKLHRAILLNPPSEPPPRQLDFDQHEPVRMLVVVMEEALETAQPLIDFHHNSGLRTEVWLADDIEDEFEIKERVLELYDDGDGLEYLFLIGDAYGDDPDVPMHRWRPDPIDRGGSPDGGSLTSHSDNWYVCLDEPDEDGYEDHIPDLSVGRLVYAGQNNLDQLELQVEKLMDYFEWNLNDEDNGAWLSRALLVAAEPEQGEDHDYELLHYIGTKRRIENADYDLDAPEFITAYGGEEGANNDFVIEQMNEGVGIVNYRGHGSENRWASWSPESFRSAQIDELENRDMPFILVSSACLNANIATYSGNCLLELFQKHEGGGTLSAHGAVVSTWTWGNSRFDSTLFLNWFDRGIYDLGGASVAAMADLVTYYDQRRYTTIGRMNVRAYIWLGDPALEIKLHAPAELEVDIEEVLPLGTEDLTAMIELDGEPLEGARLCLRSEEDGIYDVGFSDENGRVELLFDPPLEEVMELTWMVYERNAIPAQGEIFVIGGVGTLTGTVTDSADDSPVGDAELELSRFGLEAVSNPEGRYSFDEVPAGEYDLTVRAAGYISQSVHVEVVEDEVTTMDFALLFSRLELDSVEVRQHLGIGQDAVQREFRFTNEGNGDLIWNCEIDFGGDAEPYERIWEFDPSESTGDTRLNGIAFVEGNIYIAGGHNNIEPNYIYVFSMAGDLEDTFEQPEGCNGIGIRDLAASEEYLYGSAGGDILKFDLHGEVELTIDGPYNPNTALALDDQGCIWVGQGTSPLIKIDEDGNHIGVIGNDLNIRALAWYPHEPEGCFLLAFVQGDQEEPVSLYRINPATGDIIFTADLTEEDGEDIGSGLAATNTYHAGEWSLAGMVYNGREIRRLRIWNLGTETGWLSTQPDSGMVEPDQEGSTVLTFCGDGYDTDLRFTADLIFHNNGDEPLIEVPVTLVIGVDVAPLNDRPELPEEISITSHPNPFNAVTTIAYQLPVRDWIKLRLFDLTGREVVSLVDGQVDAGFHRIVWNGQSAPAGVYFCQMVTSTESRTIKLILMK